MSTLELSDLLNQEMVEIRCSRRCRPRSQPADMTAAEKNDAEKINKRIPGTIDHEYFFATTSMTAIGRAPQKSRLPPIENTLSTATSLSDHLMWQLSMQTDDASCADRLGHRRQPGRRRYLVASFDELAAMGPWPVAEVERALA
jgi:hypothetical protein